MRKVFIVEDECLVREGIRDNVAWEENGFEFAGEAGDGEMALPLIRKIKPDLLITDIKMPFMDGLELCRLVTKELPDTKIIIISGYDDFEYARQAISLQVEQYLLKPITRTMLNDVLANVREKFEKEQEQKGYNEQFLREAGEYEQYERRQFFEQIIAGSLKVGEVYERAGQLDIAIEADCYNVVLFCLQPQLTAGVYSDSVAKTQDALTEFFLNRETYLLFRNNMTSHAVLVKGNADTIAENTRSCVKQIQQCVEEIDGTLDWYVAVGEPVERLSLVKQCYDEANHRLAMRHIFPGKHLLLETQPVTATVGEDISNINNLDIDKIDPMITRNFLQTGLESEIEEFVDNYMANLGNAMESLMFRQYILLSIRFNAAIIAKNFGVPQDEFLKNLPEPTPDMNMEATKEYMAQILQKVVEIRDTESKNQFGPILKNAILYLEEHFTEENISLNSVAQAVNVSANYFSAIFSQEMGETFVEYLTKKRMEKAKQLLRQTSMRSGEIAAQVGYRDPRYFSFIFRKTVGCSPRDYRGEK